MPTGEEPDRAHHRHGSALVRAHPGLRIGSSGQRHQGEAAASRRDSRTPFGAQTLQFGLSGVIHEAHHLGDGTVTRLLAR